MLDYLHGLQVQESLRGSPESRICFKGTVTLKGTLVHLMVGGGSPSISF